MIKFIKQLFTINKKPKKGLLPLEWVMVGYLALTLLIVFFTYTKLENPDAMIWGRIRVAFITVAMWAVYRMLPCRLTLFLRITVQLALLGWWYPDTYEINRMLPNLDHVFAQWEQDVFGCQPALLFCKDMPWAVVSELMHMGYAAYYPMIVFVVVYYFLFRYKEFERAAFVVLTAFFIYYLIFIFLPVAGPTFYYKAVGISKITQGIFPNVYDYFNYYQDCLTTPGYQDGLFYHLVESAKAAGVPEQPRRHKYGAYAAGMAHRQQAHVLHPSAVLFLPLPVYRLHTGALRYRRRGRTRVRRGAVLRPHGSVERDGFQVIFRELRSYVVKELRQMTC